MTRFDELNEELRNIKNQYRWEMHTLFKKEAEKLLKEYPKVPNFGWTQYAPYFNDGEPCYFSVHADDIYIDGMCIEYEHSEAFEDYFDSEKEFDEFCVKAMNLVNEVDEDTMESMFGHGLVVVHRNGQITTEDCDHS